MRAYGSDRLRIAEDGTIELSARVAKPGWDPRVAKTLTTPEHPGTAVMWDGEWYEVVSAGRLANGVRYTLAPWREEQTIRLAQDYDEASERSRAAERSAALRANRNHRIVTLAGVVTGHLPSNVQEHLARENGVNAPWLTIVSVVPEVLAFSWVLNVFVKARLAQTAGPPSWLTLFAGYLVLDAAIRFGIAFLQSRPAGSIFGLAAYALFYALHRDRSSLPPPLAVERSPQFQLPPAAKRLSMDETISIWEPALTLLSPSDQMRLRDRHGFDYTRSSTHVALFVLFFSILGIVSSINTLRHAARFSALLSLLTAGALAVEQLVRIVRLQSRPAGSILSFVVRPFVRHLL